MSDGASREMALSEWVDQLPEIHGARREHAALVSKADESEKQARRADDMLAQRNAVQDGVMVFRAERRKLHEDIARLQNDLAESNRGWSNCEDSLNRLREVNRQVAGELNAWAEDPAGDIPALLRNWAKRLTREETGE